MGKEKTMKECVWGIIGKGWIGGEMATALNESHKNIQAVVSTTMEGGKKFADEHQIPDVYTDYREMLKDPKINIVYIATPHSTHYQMMKDALLAGKNVFCEKAIVVNAEELEECVRIALEKDLVIMDGVTLFHMPLYQKLREDVLPELGKMKMIQVNFGSLKEYNPKNRFFSMDLAGGALLDIGVYAVSFARYFMSSQPDTILTTVEKYQTGVDESSGILLKNDQGEIAVISLTMLAKQPKRGMAAGQKGYLEVYDFPRADKASVIIDGVTRVVEAGQSGQALTYELEAMENYVQDPASSRENLQRIVDVMKILTDVRRQWGIRYPFE